MAGITTSGIGSGIDIGSLVQQLVFATRTPADRRFAVTESRTQAQVSAIGQFRSLLSDLRSIAGALAKSSTFNSRTAVSSRTDLFTATGSSTASLGTFNIEVEALATAQKLKSPDGAFASINDVVGTGTLTITVGGTSFDVVVDGNNDELKQISDAINNAEGNSIVGSSVVTDDTGVHLVLTAKQTGAGNTIAVSQGAGDTLGALVYDAGNTANYTEESVAANARIIIDGSPYTGSSSNTITGVIEGVTLNLVKAADGEVGTLTIAQNPSSSASGAIASFVLQYNKLVSAMNELTKYDTENKRPSVLTGDSLIRGALSQARSIVASEVSTGSDKYDSLISIGIKTNADGTLNLDGAKLTAALKDNPTAIEKIFSSEGGIAKGLDAMLDGYLDAGGHIEVRNKRLTAVLSDINKQRDKLDDRMLEMETRLQAQFIRLDRLVAGMKSTSSFLSEQLANLPGAWKPSE